MELTKAQEWVLVYSKAVSDAWTDKNLRNGLLTQPMKTLALKYDYYPPAHIEIQFELTSNPTFPDFATGAFKVFDLPTSEKKTLIYPLVDKNSNVTDIYDTAKDQIHIGGQKCCCCCL